jgi:hypothetical protein
MEKLNVSEAQLHMYGFLSLSVHFAFHLFILAFCRYSFGAERRKFSDIVFD